MEVGGEGDLNICVNSPGCGCDGGGGTGACGGAEGFAGGMVEAGGAGDWNICVNSPGCGCDGGGGAGAWGGAEGFAGGMVEAGGAGDWNICVNSPGCDGDGAAGDGRDMSFVGGTVEACGVASGAGGTVLVSGRVAVSA